MAVAGAAAGPAGPAGRPVNPAVRDRGGDGGAAGRVRLVHRDRGVGCGPPAAGAEGAGLPAAQAGRGVRRPVGEDDPAARWPVDHDLADDLLCGWAAGLAAGCEVLSAAQLQKRRRGKARKAKARARKARRERAARGRSGKQARKAAKRERKAAAAAIAASAAAVAGGRAKLPAGSLPAASRFPRGTRCFPPRPTATPATSRAARPGRRRQGLPRRQGQRPGSAPAPGFFWHGTRLNAAQRAVDRKTNETTVIGPVIDGMDLTGVCLTVDALHSLADLGKRVLARGGHVIFVIKGNQPRTYKALDDIAWEQVPVTAATFEADPAAYRPAASRSPPRPQA